MSTFRVYITFLLLFISTAIFSQKNSIDSLQNIINTAATDTVRIDAQLKLSLEYIYVNKANEAIQIAEEAIKKSEQIKDKQRIANSYNRLASVYLFSYNYPKALEYYFITLEKDKVTKNAKNVCSTLMNIGNVHDDLNDFPKALFYYLQAAKMQESVNDLPGKIGIYNNIANVYRKQSDFKNALSTYFKALKFSEELEDYYLPAGILKNIGITYSESGDYIEAIKYSLQSLDKYIQSKDTASMASIYVTIGNIHIKSKEYKEAFEYYNKSLNIKNERLTQRHFSGLYLDLASAYVEIKDYDNAAIYIQKAQQSVDKVGLLVDKRNLEYLLSKFYEQNNQIDKSFEHYKKATALNDSVFNENKAKQITAMKIKYEVDEKERELEVAKSEQKIAEYKNYIFIAVIIFVAVISILLINRQISKRERQKEIYQIRQKLVHAELERKKLEKETLETTLKLNLEKLNSYNTLVKEKTLLVEKMGEQIEEFKNKKVQQLDARTILSTIEEYIDPQKYWEEFITSFNLMHKNFFNELTKTYPDLTQNELRLCTLIKCNLGNKEIANILNITSDSVKKSKTRLRKKLNLDADDNLIKHILDLNS